MPLQLNFEWENVTPSTTLSNPSPPQSAAEFIYPPRQMQPRQAAFYRNLVRMAEQTRSRILPVRVITLLGDEKRLDSGCVKLAEHAGFISLLADGPLGVVEEIRLAWDPTNS